MKVLVLVSKYFPQNVRRYRPTPHHESLGGAGRHVQDQQRQSPLRSREMNKVVTQALKIVSKRSYLDITLSSYRSARIRGLSSTYSSST